MATTQQWVDSLIGNLKVINKRIVLLTKPRDPALRPITNTINNLVVRAAKGDFRDSSWSLGLTDPLLIADIESVIATYKDLKDMQKTLTHRDTLDYLEFTQLNDDQLKDLCKALTLPDPYVHILQLQEAPLLPLRWRLPRFMNRDNLCHIHSFLRFIANLPELLTWIQKSGPNNLKGMLKYFNSSYDRVSIPKTEPEVYFPKVKSDTAGMADPAEYWQSLSEMKNAFEKSGITNVAQSLNPADDPKLDNNKWNEDIEYPAKVTKYRVYTIGRSQKSEQLTAPCTTEITYTKVDSEGKITGHLIALLCTIPGHHFEIDISNNGYGTNAIIYDDLQDTKRPGDERYVTSEDDNNMKLFKRGVISETPVVTIQKVQRIIAIYRFD